MEKCKEKEKYLGTLRRRHLTGEDPILLAREHPILESILDGNWQRCRFNYYVFTENCEDTSVFAIEELWKDDWPVIHFDIILYYSMEQAAQEFFHNTDRGISLQHKDQKFKKYRFAAYVQKKLQYEEHQKWVIRRHETRVRLRNNYGY